MNIKYKVNTFTEEDSDIVLNATNNTIIVIEYIEELLQQGDFFTWSVAKEEITRLYKASRDLCEIFEMAENELTNQD